MDIDLLLTSQGETGLICSENLVQKAAGVVFNMQEGLLTIEYKDMEYLDLNIPVEQDYFETLEFSFIMHIGAFKSGHIAQAYQVPLMLLDDPYRGANMGAINQPANPLLAFEQFVKKCVHGQPIHRDDFGNEESMGCILGDASPSSLEFAPHLERRRALEAAPKIAPGNAPGLGLGGSGGGTVVSGRGGAKGGSGKSSTDDGKSKK